MKSTLKPVQMQIDSRVCLGMEIGGMKSKSCTDIDETVIEFNVSKSCRPSYVGILDNVFQFCRPGRRSKSMSRLGDEFDKQSNSSTKIYDDAMLCLCFTCEKCLKVIENKSINSGLSCPEILEFIELQI